jgi:hypothetical protein
VAIVGQPGTVLEVEGGSIIIDFRKGGGSSTDVMKASNRPPIERGTPLAIKKNKVAKIHICEIKFNRNKAAQ